MFSRGEASKLPFQISLFLPLPARSNQAKQPKCKEYDAACQHDVALECLASYFRSSDTTVSYDHTLWEDGRAQDTQQQAYAKSFQVKLYVISDKQEGYLMAPMLILLNTSPNGWLHNLSKMQISQPVSITPFELVEYSCLIGSHYNGKSGRFFRAKHAGRR
ncbi:uncharacterized protein CLUP02_13984 [Colletotrichum lupini]|uniref:Uncharacterized protein n=1 Tax=Colletotrichum lupini TaxID=145971 RepID=A0A9Q8WMV4_9PEZI|nr:uncharacterized protein CLUP02_13984 [Colletotrichum lupini]UQC88460.1 hypothetical protein CLUP02_13984 [Colletotrichum lupini]